MKKVIYLCGPHQEHQNNYRQFALTQEKLEACGFKVLNPHEFLEGLNTSKLTGNEILKICVAKMMEADTLITMPDWETNLDASHVVKIALLVGIDVENRIRFFHKNEIKLDVAA